MCELHATHVLWSWSRRGDDKTVHRCLFAINMSAVGKGKQSKKKVCASVILV